MIDANGDGVLSRAEVIKACRASERVRTLLGLPKNIRQEDGTRDSFEVVFQKFDADDSKSITLDEFSSRLLKSTTSPQAPVPTPSQGMASTGAPYLPGSALHCARSFQEGARRRSS